MITFFDSAKKQKIPFTPIRDNQIRLYVCGPTVYDDAHLGTLVALLFLIYGDDYFYFWDLK